MKSNYIAYMVIAIIMFDIIMAFILIIKGKKIIKERRTPVRDKALVMLFLGALLWICFTQTKWYELWLND